MHAGSLSLSHNFYVFIRGCFAVPVLGPGVSATPKATQPKAARLRLAAGRCPGSGSLGQSHQTCLRWRAVCSRHGLDVVMNRLRSPMNPGGGRFAMPQRPFAPLVPRSSIPRAARGGPGWACGATAGCHRTGVPRRKRGGTPSISRGVPAGPWLQPLIAQDFPSPFQCLIAGSPHASSTCSPLQRSS